MPSFFDERGDPALSPFTVLNLPTTATEPEIKKAYRTAMLQLHPDKLSPNLSESEIAAVTEKFHNVKDAYEFLTSPQYLTARRLYQAKMASRRAEYERREAFLRRAGSSTTTGANTGAWSTRTRMTEAPSYYKMPDTTGVPRSSGYRTNVQPRYYSNASHAVDPTKHARSKSRNAASRTTRANAARGGYASDGNFHRTTKSFRETTTTTTSAAFHRAPPGTRERKTRRSADAPPPPPPSTRPGRSDRHAPKEDAARVRAKSEPRSSSRRHKSRDGGGSGTTTAESGDDRARFDERKEETNAYVKKRSNNHGGGKTSFHTTATATATNNNARRETSFQSSANTKRTTRGRPTQSSSPSLRQQQRYRAKSAPARCGASEKKINSNNNNNNNSGSNNNNNNTKVPKEFYCPLSKRIMKDPVIDPDGNAYEREAIERWLRVQSSSPITNGYLTVEMLRPSKELKSRIYKVVGMYPDLYRERAGFIENHLLTHAPSDPSSTGKPRSKSQSRAHSRFENRSSSPNQNQTSNEYVSGRVLVDSYLREISSKSKLSVALDGMGICAFSYRKITFVIEVPILPNAGFMVYSSFDARSVDRAMLSRKIDAWNKWLADIKSASRVSHVMAGSKTVFSLRGGERDMMKCEVFQKTLEYFVEMSLKLHNILHPEEIKSIDNVCLTTRPPVCVA
ncbi:hypothetical protein ACHAW6_011381 [Cyclotella cf. meneghiniana]